MTDLNADLNSAQRTALVNLMLSYLNDGIVAQHPTLDHFDRHLFTHHEQYIGEMEVFLKANGGSQFVPLPMWNPANPIPPEFNVVKPRNDGTARPPLVNLNPNQPKPTQYAYPGVCSFTNADDLGNAINGWHGGVHGSVGGTMGFLATASAAPIFWPWHKYVNTIYEDWLRCQGWTGFMIQSRFGVKGNFEMLVPRPRQGGFNHYWRNNDAPIFPWRGPRPFGDTVGDAATQVALIQGNFGNNLEAVARVGNRLAHFWRISGPPWTWHGPFFFGSGVSGNPSFVQGRFGNKGNFEVVVPRAAGGLAHYWRNNDAPGFPWSGETAFATGLGRVNSVALIQGNFDKNLEVVARVGTRLGHFWRRSGPPWTWSGPNWFFDGAAGAPGFIQGKHGSRGNFELVTPLAAGRMAHLWRNNDVSGFPWSGPTNFGSGRPPAISLIQGNFGSPGNLELAAWREGRAAIYWRLGRPPWTWSGPTANV
jgi:hypothetical protein